MQARIDARLAARAAAGPTAQETVGARMGRQPTPDSIAAAEQKLHEVPAATIDSIAGGMVRARAADDAGDMAACAQALESVARALGPAGPP